ncbi:MAG: nucleoside-diphosphate sugar epimerase/dehydratase [Pseudoruegeria sp.]
MLKLLKSLTRPQKRAILMTFDVLLVPLALLLTVAIQQNTIHPISSMYGIIIVLPYLMAGAALLSWLLGISKIRLDAYEKRALKKTAAFAIYLTAFSYLLLEVSGNHHPFGTYVTLALIYFLLSVASRVLMLQFVDAIYRRAEPRVPVLIYGAGTTGAQLASALNAHQSINPVAFVDDNNALKGLIVSGLPVFTPVHIPDLIKSHKVKRILLAIPSASQPKQSQIAAQLGKLQVEVQVLPSFSQLIGEEDLVGKLKPVVPGSLLNRPKLAKDLRVSYSVYSGRNVLISGAGGSIGSELCRQVLACRPARIVLAELSELALYNLEMDLRPFAKEMGVEIIPTLGSITDSRLCAHILKRHEINVVLHAAAYKHVPMVEHNILVGLSNNVFGTRTLAKAAQDAGVERFVLISSDKAVHPTNIMGASKRLAEHVIQDFATRSSKTIFTMVRFGNVLGSSGSVVPLFQEQIARGGPITLTHKDVTRYFMTIDEAVKLVLLAGAFAEGGEVFVLDMGEPRKILDLARQIIERSGYTVRDENTPDGDIEVVVTGLRPGEKLHEELMITEGHISTKHKKIFEAREHVPSEIEVASCLRALREAVAAGDEAAARDVVVNRVEGYRHFDQQSL